ncbi:hypothetical protein HDU91_002171 [Kappamyces sp. JEL0680]|nr:hypothetical protein HDU91_002171 [Kappamyces sp. JEL0680]
MAHDLTAHPAAADAGLKKRSRSAGGCSTMLANAAALPLLVTSYSTTTASLSVSVAVQNIAYTKVVLVKYCDAAKSCTGSFSCSYASTLNSTHENWGCASSSFSAGLSSFTVDYTVSGTTYSDRGPNGLGYPASLQSASSTSGCDTVTTVTSTVTSMVTSMVTPAPTSTVIMQAFTWDEISGSKRPTFYNYLATQVDNWHNAGFQGIWLPPHMDSADPQGYGPQRWYVGPSQR